MEARKLPLQPRLACLADCVPRGARLADVGTDHGYLPVMLLQRRLIQSAIASDINEEPLSHARRTAAEYGVTEGIEFRLCNGLSAIGADEVDTVVIAGMGGEMIINILSTAPWELKSDITLLLQPMTKPEILRAWLVTNGYKITRERLVRDKGVLYAVIIATAGESAAISMAQAYCGVETAHDPLYGEYVDERIAKLSRAADGLRRSNRSDAPERIAELETVIAELRERKGEWKHDNGI